MAEKAPPLPPAELGARVRQALLAWYACVRRNLPWRRARDPYAIWVSEVMLQQTRVEAVIPYYERWMARLPTVAALSAAPLDEVLGLWSGLGYYSRARNLQRAAQAIVLLHGGALPGSVEELRALPGIGRYTAGAIASIAFGRPAPAVDGNALRVLARLFLATDPEDAWRIAGALVPSGAAAGAFNQALMELGATVCAPRRPRCLLCPLSQTCSARARGLETEIPAARPARVVPLVEAAVLLLRRRARVLLVRRPPRGLWGGLWEFPTGASPEDAAGRVGLAVTVADRLGVIDHTLTHRRMRFFVYRTRGGAGPVRLAPAREGYDGYDAYRWLALSEVSAAPVSSATRRIAAAGARGASAQ